MTMQHCSTFNWKTALVGQPNLGFGLNTESNIKCSSGVVSILVESSVMTTVFAETGCPVLVTAFLSVQTARRSFSYRRNQNPSCTGQKYHSDYYYAKCYPYYEHQRQRSRTYSQTNVPRGMSSMVLTPQPRPFVMNTCSRQLQPQHQHTQLRTGFCIF